MAESSDSQVVTPPLSPQSADVARKVAACLQDDVSSPSPGTKFKGPTSPSTVDEDDDGLAVEREAAVNVDKVNGPTKSSKSDTDGDPMAEQASRGSIAEVNQETPKNTTENSSGMKLYEDAVSALKVMESQVVGATKEALWRVLGEFKKTAESQMTTEVSPTLDKALQKVDILYRVCLEQEGEVDKYWYQDVPFSGLDYERFEPFEPSEDEEVCILDVIMDVGVKTLAETNAQAETVLPPGETRQTWKGRKDHVFGKQIQKYHPTIPAIRIKSHRLLTALQKLISYYPQEESDMSSVLHPYKMLLLHYPLIAAFRSTYKGPQECIPGNITVPKGKVQTQGQATVLHRSKTPAIAENDLPVHEQIKGETRLGDKDLSASLVSLKAEAKSPEEQIQQILELETSSNIGTGDFEEGACDKLTAYCIGILLFYLAPFYRKTVIPELQCHQKGKATHKMLWTLFKPGIDVFALVNKQYAGFVVQSCEFLEGETNSRSEKIGKDQVAVTVWNLDFEGSEVNRVANIYYISEFEGLKDIATLEVIPMKYLKDAQDRQNYLQKRGQQYCNIVRRNVAYRAYDGHFWGKDSKHYKGDVIIDRIGYNESDVAEPLEYGTHEPSDDGGGLRWKDYNKIDPKMVDSLTAHQLFLLPQHLYGFALAIKEWKIFDIDKIRDIDEPLDPMQNLLLPKCGRHREIILALLNDYSSGPADFVPHKGQSRVILLHGHPGTGKTYTVECVSKECKRPLLSLTVADLGNKEEVMERKLSTWFKLAETWNAIILLDEADQFLEERRPGDLQRNCLVAVFLRTMEYYSGILFLTSNRVGQIDVAFASRILIALEYPVLSNEQRVDLWALFFKMHNKNDGRIRFDWDAREYIRSDEVAVMKLNGREIRNAIQAAILIARQAQKQDLKAHPKTNWTSDKLVVDMDHIQVCLKQRQAFEDYRNGVFNMTDDERSWRLNNRALPPDPSSRPTRTSAYGWREPTTANSGLGGSSPASGFRQH